MTQIKNRFDMENFINNGDLGNKKLPNFFVDNYDGVGVFSSLALSVIFHIAFVLLLIFFSIFFNLVFPHLPKPELPNRNIEFKLVHNESKPPINKNTKNRSDRDSQAGGKYDPKRSESEPSKAAAPQVKSSAPKKQIQKVQPKKQVQKPVANPQAQKTPIKQPVKPIEQPSKVVSKPSPIKPSVVKPAVKPVAKPQGTVVPTAPKVVSAPKSPFAVPVPKTSGPVGTTYKPSGTPSASSSGGNTGSVAPVPKFSSTGAASSKGSSGVGGGQYASKGSYGGYGIGGNPSPGNPNGAPGIDAIREPNWGPYMKDLEQRIKRNWTPPKGDSSKRVVITFTIGRDGRLLSSKVTKSSGVPLADRAAMSAIELTAPFRPLPPEFRGQSVPIEFTFDYNVINSIMR